ncbi:cupin domain-containing protein [Bacteroidales bacterium]|nr:cupin domain-containing protein [Bacteroidales bacterium]
MNVQTIINQLNLQPHPEGGYYHEMYRCNRSVVCDFDQIDDTRSLATSIYFLLETGQVSKFHQLKSDEIWYFHSGSPVKIHCVNPDGSYAIQYLGTDFVNGEQPQIIIPRNTIFGAEVLHPNSHALMSCMVAPGFDFKDFRMVDTKEMMEILSDRKELVKRFT